MTTPTFGAMAATGPNPAKAKFFSEVASAFEFLALYHALPAAQQVALQAAVQSFCAVPAQAAVNERKSKS